MILLFAATGLTGCQSFGPLRIKPVTPQPHASLHPDFTSGYYRRDRDDVYHFILLANTKTSYGTIKQVMILRVFWKPIPGVTPILSTAINTTFRYLVFTPNGCGMYQGAGFIRLHNGSHAHEMHASIVDGDLRLTGASGYFTDAIGPSQISGDFKAIYSKPKTISLILQVKRKFFAATLADHPHSPR